MLKIYIGSGYDPQEVVVPSNMTVSEVFKENGVYVPTGAVVSFNSRRLGDNELNLTLEALKVKDEDAITITEKQNSAR